MRLCTLALLTALVIAPACGGGSNSGPVGPTVAASFSPAQPSPGPKTVAMAEGSKSNDVVSVNVTLTGASGVFGAAFEVTYDAANTVYLGYAHGAAFEQGGGNPNYTVDGTTNPGRIVVGVARTSGTGTNVSGTSTVVSFQFRVKQSGTYPLTVVNSMVYDAQPTPQPISGVTWFAGAVTGI